LVVAAGGLAGDDVEVVDYGGAAQVEEVLAGAAVAGAAALPVADVGDGVLDLDALAQAGRARSRSARRSNTMRTRSRCGSARCGRR
jgi:hypothetical protein